MGQRLSRQFKSYGADAKRSLLQLTTTLIPFIALLVIMTAASESRLAARACPRIASMAIRESETRAREEADELAGVEPQQLTPEQQDVLALRFGQGYSLEETAAHMKKKVNAVKALQFRALAALQRQIGDK